MTRQRLLKSALLGVAICSVLAAGAYASRTSYHQVRLPGVDHHGNLKNEYGSHARLKLVCDTHHRTFCAIAKGHVRNHSGHRQVYRDRIAVAAQSMVERMNIPRRAIQITRDEYTVERGSLWHHHRASCCAILCGKINRNGSSQPQAS